MVSAWLGIPSLVKDTRYDVCAVTADRVTERSAPSSAPGSGGAQPASAPPPAAARIKNERSPALVDSDFDFHIVPPLQHMFSERDHPRRRRPRFHGAE